jgi:predicted O-methyltransferase YrrM
MNLHPAELLAKWKPFVDASLKIPTWTEPESLAYCAEVASRSKVIIESGTYMGASALIMLNANPALHLWAIDHFAVFGTKEITEHFLADHIKEGRAELIKGDSSVGGAMLQHMKGKVDAVWCDDGHAEEDLIRDITWLLPLLRSGGELFGHDWDGDNNVARGVKAKIPVNKLTFPVPRVWSYRVP